VVVAGAWCDRDLRELARAEEPDLPAVPDEFLRALVGGIAELV